MNKGLIFKSLAAAVIIYAGAGFFGVPYILKNVVPQKVHEATNGGNLKIESATFNPFTFRLGLEHFSFKTPQNTDFITLENFVININPIAFLWKGEVVVGEISLGDPKVTISRDDKGDFNFKWLTELGDDNGEDKPSKPLKLLIKNFSLKNGIIDYRDYADGKAYALGLGPIGFSLDNIDLRNLTSENGKMRLYATINDGGFIDLNGNIDALSPLKLKGNMAFHSGKLYTPWRYFKEKFPIEVADGEAAFGFDYRFDSNDVNATELSNLSFDMNKLRIIPKGEDNNLLSVAGVHLKEGDVFPMRKIFSAKSLEIGGVNVAATRAKNGQIDWVNYIEEIQKAFPEDDNETKVPWTFHLNQIALENIGAVWKDFAPLEPYQVSVNNLRVHTGMLSSDEKLPINLSVASDAISLLRQQDNSVVIGVNGIGIDGVDIDRAGRFARVQKISLLQPHVAIKRLKDGSIDLSRYAYASGSKEAPSSETPWSYRLDEMGLNNGLVDFVDEVPSKTVALNLDQLNISLRGFESNPALKNQFMVETRINGKSTLSAGGDLIRSPLQSNGNFNLKGIELSTFDPYLQGATYASLRRGNLSVSGAYSYAANKATLNGKVALNDWVVNDSRDDSVLLGWQNIGATPFVYAYPDNRLKINQLAIDGLYTNALIDSKKILNYTTLSKNTASEGNISKPSDHPFGLDIVKLLLRDSSATFSDQSLPLPFKTYIHDLEGSVLGISTTKDVTTFVKLRGGVDQYGLAKIDGSLNTKAPKQFTDIKVAFDNLELKSYTPYSLQFLGYKIDGGKLFLNLGYKINDGKLNGANQVLIKQIELGAEKEGGSPWPMRLVVALLEDSEGVMDISLPIEGDVNSPDFKYGKVVWQVIGNLFTKAVTSPFKLLGSMMGIESDKLSNIDFEGGSTTILPPQIEKLDQVTAMLIKRPKLSLEVYGASEAINDTYALKARKLVAAALKRNKNLKIDSPQAMSVELLEDMATDILDKGELKALKAKNEAAYPEEAAYVRHYSADLTEKLVALQMLSSAELQALAQERAHAVVSYLGKNPEIQKRVILKGVESVKAEVDNTIPLRLQIVVP
ncbi:MAG: DUF748 domain-containing protein [Sulfuricurvum sp.]|nr:DUF748 domain-containing protein [Sulfuricurvum sp.]